MDFVAIDFETANASRASACEIGVTVVNNGRIVDSYSHLIRPRENVFHFYNTKIHGINAHAVAREPEFHEVWTSIHKDFQDTTLVAHNAAFDMGVLRTSLEIYNLPVPPIPYLCSVQVARKTWPNQGAYRLNLMAEFLGLEFNHHRAGDDALICAEILIAAGKEYKVNSLPELAQQTGLQFKQLSRLAKSGPQNSKPPRIPLRNAKAKETNFFYNKHVVFTRGLQGMKRQRAFEIVAELGGYPGMEVNVETDLLVVGGPDFREDGKKPATSKMREALKHISDGAQITMISEYEFIEHIPKHMQNGIQKILR